VTACARSAPSSQAPHQTIHWSTPDPATDPGSDAETYPAFAQTAAELEARIRFLLHRINDQPTNQEVTRT
jgi:ArsR family transcriptional regulator, arsenate/arsenite/antimonite-responsive transcriptional repressor / arsenate reductase (thioredoxin)